MQNLILFFTLSFLFGCSNVSNSHKKAIETIEYQYSKSIIDDLRKCDDPKDLQDFWGQFYYKYISTLKDSSAISDLFQNDTTSTEQQKAYALLAMWYSNLHGKNLQTIDALNFVSIMDWGIKKCRIKNISYAVESYQNLRRLDTVIIRLPVKAYGNTGLFSTYAYECPEEDERLNPIEAITFTACVNEKFTKFYTENDIGFFLVLEILEVNKNNTHYLLEEKIKPGYFIVFDLNLYGKRILPE